MAVSTVSDICRGALQALGVVGAGDTPSAEDSSIALELLNGLLDQWAAERLAIYFSTRTEVTIVASDGSYTVGSGGDVNIVRPVYLDEVRLLNNNVTPSIETPLTWLDDQAYRAWPMKTQTNTYPIAWWYNPTFTSSRGTLELLPIPTGSGLEFVVYSPTAIARYAAITDTFSLPPGYERMLRMNLAMELAAPFEREPSALVTRGARESLATVKRANIRPVELQLSCAALIGSNRGRYDIYTDQG